MTDLTPEQLHIINVMMHKENVIYLLEELKEALQDSIAHQSFLEKFFGSTPEQDVKRAERRLRVIHLEQEIRAKADELRVYSERHATNIA